MVKSIMPIFLFLFSQLPLMAQSQTDSSILLDGKMITLSAIVVNKKVNIANFIKQVINDSTFYKAFRNLHLLNFTSINDIRMLNRDGSSAATLYGKTQQIRSGNCRSMQVLEEQTTGDYYDEQHQLNYYTAQMYASLFFTNGIICGEDNIVTGREFNTKGKAGMDKHKEQLKMLFFNPGRRINGLPFMSGKTSIYDNDMAANYNMEVDIEEHNKVNCYVFKQKVKSGMESNVVVDEMTTWFDEKTMEVTARNYSISYNAMLYDFKVLMEVQMTHAGNLLVPAVIRYNGNWKAIFKKRERGIFTATLLDFK